MGAFVPQVGKMTLREVHKHLLVEQQFEGNSVLSDHKACAFDLSVLILNAGSVGMLLAH